MSFGPIILEQEPCAIGLRADGFVDALLEDGDDVSALLVIEHGWKEARDLGIVASLDHGSYLRSTDACAALHPIRGLRTATSVPSGECVDYATIAAIVRKAGVEAQAARTRHVPEVLLLVRSPDVAEVDLHVIRIRVDHYAIDAARVETEG